MAAKRQRDSIFMIDDGSDDGEARSVTIDLDGEGELESVQDTNGEPRHKRQRSVAAKPLISGALRRNAAPAPAASSRPALASASTLAPAPTPAPILRNEPTDLTGIEVVERETGIKHRVPHPVPASAPTPAPGPMPAPIPGNEPIDLTGNEVVGRDAKTKHCVPRPALARAPTPARAPTLAPATTPALAPTPSKALVPCNEPVDLTGIEVIERDTGIKRRVPEAEFLPYLKKRGTLIFSRAASKCLDRDLERSFQDWPHVLTQLNKGKVIDRYENVWKKSLVKAKKSIQVQLTAAEERMAGHQWEEEEKAYGRKFVLPLRKLLKTAEGGIDEFDELIRLLKDPDGQIAASKKDKKSRASKA